MALATLSGKLLVRAGRLAQSLACCCARWCRQTGQDACGNPVYGCANEQVGSIGECTPECKPPDEPCECGPETPCPECEECIDRKCEPIEDCCGENTPCPPCEQCVDNVCVPCGECEQCVDGACVPCGPCQKCEGGGCVPCGPEEVCIGGVCVPKQYYCCWASAEDKRLNTNNTTCKAATVSGGTQTSPCGTDTEEGETGEVDLTKSGPYANLQQCEPNCRKYKCAPDACGNNECVPDPDGPYATRAECLAACPADPCSSPCTFTGANAPGIYSIDACERDICVSYVSPDSRPIRVQIWGPTLDQDCNIIASRVIKADSDWRGEECCDCDSRPAGDLEGGPKGQITWNKPRGVTAFEVVVLNPCGATVAIDVQACAECADLPEPEQCPCNLDADCANACHCCNGVCQAEPCGGCQPCECAIPDQHAGGNNVCFVSCVAVGIPNFLQCGCGEFNGVGADMGVQWAEGYVAANAGCTILLQTYTGNEDVFWRVWKCSGGQWLNASDDALVVDPEVPNAQNLGGYWCQERNGACEEEPAWAEPPCEEPP